MPLFARRYSPNTSTRRSHIPDEHPPFTPMSKPPGSGKIRPHDLPDNPPEASGDAEEVEEG